MEKEFVPYPLALRLKALGFDGPCFGFYKLGDIDIYYDTILQGKNHKFRNNTQLNFYGDLKEKVSAPTFSQAFRWFREKHNLHSFIDCKWKNLGWEFELVDLNKMEVVSLIGKKYGYNTPEEAELACLEKLIEIVESKSK
jgi:hypothetical protein